jgi:hypothetical protein
VFVARLREFEVDKVSRGGGTFGQDPSRWDLGVDQVKDRLHRQLFETEAQAIIAPLDALDTALQNPYKSTIMTRLVQRSPPVSIHGLRKLR